jgi:hypothetical protein
VTSVNDCPSCGLSIPSVFPPDTPVRDTKRGSTGVIREWTNGKERGKFTATVDYDDPSINTSHFRPTQLSQRFELIDVSGDHASSQSTRPDYAVKTQGGSWVGTDEFLEPMTQTFPTLKSLRNEFDATTSKGVGKDQKGDKIYQLILPPIRDGGSE